MKEVVYTTALGTVTVQSDWDALHIVFARRCGWTIPGPKSVTVVVCLVSRLDLPPVEDGRFLVMDAVVETTPDSIQAWVPEPSFCAGVILDWLWLAVASYCHPENWQLLHAAAITEGEGVTLICGPSGSGKTTTLLAFLDEGAQFLSDDAVLLNTTDGMVWPWTCDLHLHPVCVQERWPEHLGSTVDFNGKVRLSAQELGYPVSLGGILKRIIVLAAEGEEFSLSHDGVGFESSPGLDVVQWFVSPEYWFYRCPDVVSRVQSEHAPGCPPFATLTLFQGKGWALARWIEAWRTLNLPHHAHVLWCCNSEDDGFWEQIQEVVAELRADYPNLLLWRDLHRVGLKDRQVAYLYQQGRTRVPPECQFVLVHEDDVLPDPDTFPEMLKEWARRSGKDIVGIPVPHIYEYGEITALAWDYVHTDRGVQAGPNLEVREARRHTGPSLVGGISFSFTLIPMVVFNKASLSHGHDNYPASGYDHLFCREATRNGTSIVALWQVGCIHLKREHPGCDVRMRKRRILVLGAGEEIADGATWEVVGREPADDVAKRIQISGCDYALIVDPSVHLSTPYIDALIEHFAWNFPFACTWGYRETEDGRLSWGTGPGAMVRASACRGSKANTLDELRAWFASEGWREGHLDKAHYHVRGSGNIGYVRPTDPRREQSPYRVLMLNRDQYDGWQPGFGGDLVQVQGYRDGLRNLGVYADLRPSNFGELDGYNLIHLHHVQFPWAWQQADWCDGRLPVVVSTITHGHPPKDRIARVVEKADYLICYGPAEAEYYATLFPEKASRVRVVPMGVRPELLTNTYNGVPRKPSVLMAGKYCGYKNQLSVLDACRMLDVPVTFCGFNDDPVPDSYVDRLRDAVAKYPKARMLGKLEGQVLVDAYDEAWVHVNASLFEPFGQVTLDALARKCNIVHSQNSWVAQQFGAVGTLCNPDSVDSIVHALERELSLPRGWANVRPPTHTEAAKCMMAVYEEALAR